ncbi:MAG: hypothetical protein ACKV1O_10265, partial [Saprospiraceae bacterium]
SRIKGSTKQRVTVCCSCSCSSLCIDYAMSGMALHDIGTLKIKPLNGNKQAIARLFHKMAGIVQKEAF